MVCYSYFKLVAILDYEKWSKDFPIIKNNNSVGLIIFLIFAFTNMLNVYNQ